MAAAFDQMTAKNVENEVCASFGCSASELIGFSDTFFKKVVVFLLFKHFGFNKRIIGRFYQITYLYVPTVAEEMDCLMVRNVLFCEKINEIIKTLNP